MVLHRVVKWAATGVLALGAIPAIGLARLSQASLPTSAITVTPTTYAPSAPKKLSSHVSYASHVHAAKPVKASLRTRAVKHHTIVKAKHHVTPIKKHHVVKPASTHKHVHAVHPLHGKTVKHVVHPVVNKHKLAPHATRRV